MFSLKVLIFFGLLFASKATKSENFLNFDFSLNSYVHPAYPGRCVIDMEPALITLELGQSVSLPNLPCVSLLCVGDGYGALYKCNHSSPPESCRYGEFLDLNVDFPECCKRKVVCD
ncbi:uncharacterized protein [Drosophila pseudoobscura]|uniref:Uncharacterized protein isoform X2 n=1 Tax=Drosophila pseudoobscura pseudoobscura TaxID=46245 RepID=A0A0R3NTW2_DROPS|nr:uncharacterized protein LOC26531978 isoform X2 [Drosophila pseudoobscura]